MDQSQAFSYSNSPMFIFKVTVATVYIESDLFKSKIITLYFRVEPNPNSISLFILVLTFI